MKGQCSVGQGLPPQVFLTVASNPEAAPGSPQRQHGGGPLVLSCGQYYFYFLFLLSLYFLVWTIGLIQIND